MLDVFSATGGADSGPGSLGGTPTEDKDGQQAFGAGKFTYFVFANGLIFRNELFFILSLFLIYFCFDARIINTTCMHSENGRLFHIFCQLYSKYSRIELLVHHCNRLITF
jgi:hypothetical protein